MMIFICMRKITHFYYIYKFRFIFNPKCNKTTSNSCKNYHAFFLQISFIYFFVDFSLFSLFGSRFYAFNSNLLEPWCGGLATFANAWSAQLWRRPASMHCRPRVRKLRSVRMPTTAWERVRCKGKVCGDSAIKSGFILCFKTSSDITYLKTYPVTNQTGFRWRPTMEDSHTHLLDSHMDEGAAFFAVYDGHGGAR